MGQQADALYIRKQLEEVNFSSENAMKPRRERKIEQKNTPNHLFKTDVTEKFQIRPLSHKKGNTKTHIAFSKMSEAMEALSA